MDTALYSITPLLIGYILDLCLGDPRWLPHPIRWYGWAIAQMNRYLNSCRYRLLKGAVAVALLVPGVFILLHGLLLFLYPYPLLYIAVASILVFYGLANKSLITEGKDVIAILEAEGLEAGRKRLAWIVGRDVQDLSANEIRKAVLETLSENLSDGVVAPIFYYAVAGVPGIMTYKMINTLDSMIGYKSEKYRSFGYTAAKLDDLVNYIPARITALLIALVNQSRRAWQFTWLYGAAHDSPNAGYPEAALAGVLNCQFGGPNYYKGRLVEKPYIGVHAKTFGPEDMRIAKKTNHGVTLCAIVISIVGTIVYLNRFTNA